MNILFANYGDCTSNSLNHIGAFANQLTRLGHACIVAIPDHPETQEVLPKALFRVATFAEVLSDPRAFPNRQGADVVHAWTPRENVRKFAMGYLTAQPRARLVIHLEDNEEHLTDAFLKRDGRAAANFTEFELAAQLPPNLSVPLRARHFLTIAHGITHITNKLRELIPAKAKMHLLLPGLEESEAISAEEIETERRSIGHTDHEKLVVYTGSTTFANLPDVKCLTVAVRLLNEAGCATRLVRTGHQPAEYQQILAEVGGDFVNDLGFVAKSRLSRLLAAADVLVQPGAADPFNDYRLPSKLPEFLWSGRPTVLPATNIGMLMRDGREGLLLRNATPEEIARCCLEVFNNAELATSLSKGAKSFARLHFDITSNTGGLVAFYEQLHSADPVFGDHPACADETAALVDQHDSELGQRVRGLVHRVSQLEADLRTVDALRLRHRSGERYNAAKIQEQRHVTENVRTELQSLTQELVPMVNRLEQEKAELQNLIHHNEREHAKRLQSLESKLQRITHSGSWAFTAPFRALRRTLLDPLLKQDSFPETTETASHEPAVAATAEIPIDAGLPHSIDEPADWAAVPTRGRIRGWSRPRRVLRSEPDPRPRAIDASTTC